MSDTDAQPQPPAIRSLLGGKCPVCGSAKAAGRTFCDGCAVAAGPAVRAMLCVAADDYPAAFERAFLVMGREPLMEK